MGGKVLISFAIIIILLIIVGFFVKKNPGFKFSSIKNAPAETQQKFVTIDNKKINVEVANTESLRQKGLGGRSSLAENGGMLFIWDTKPITASFWMKDMIFPIDIIWISGNKVVKIDKNVPFYPKDTPDNQLKVYSSDTPIDYVLEVNSGFSNNSGIKVGDAVQNLSGL